MTDNVPARRRSLESATRAILTTAARRAMRVLPTADPDSHPTGHVFCTDRLYTDTATVRITVIAHSMTAVRHGAVIDPKAPPAQTPRGPYVAAAERERWVRAREHAQALRELLDATGVDAVGDLSGARLAFLLGKLHIHAARLLDVVDSLDSMRGRPGLRDTGKGVHSVDTPGDGGR